jgi:hypothetical protein
MFPKLSFNQLSTNIQTFNKTKNLSVNKEVNENAKSMTSVPPILPPRMSIDESIDIIPPINDDKPIWFVVMSPRETKGIAGPWSLNHLKHLYSHQEINDRTLCWTEGDSDWRQLLFQKNLRPKLLKLPIIPPKIISYEEEIEIFNPVPVPVPVVEKKLQQRKFKK